jgi:hypothetical protein
MDIKAQWGIVGMMVAVIFTIMAFQFITPLKSEITKTRNATNLDCTNTSITTGEKMTCIAVDLSLPYFIFVCLAAAGGYLAGRQIEYRYSPPQQ